MNKKKKMKFHPLGITPENITVVDNIFKLFDSLGLPLDVIFDMLKERNCIPSWIHFYDDAIAQGWSHETILNRLTINVSDVYGKDFCDEVIKRLELYVASK